MPPSHPLCTAFLQYHLHFCRDKQLADALSHHITSGPCHSRDPVPLAPSVPFPPGPSCSSQLPFCLCPSGQVFFCFLPVVCLSGPVPLPFCLPGGASLSLPLSLIWVLSLGASLILFLPQLPFSSQLVVHGDQKEIGVGIPSGLKGVFFERHLSPPPVEVEVRLAG